MLVLLPVILCIEEDFLGFYENVVSDFAMPSQQ